LTIAEFEERLDGSFAKRQQRLDQFVVDVFVRTAYRSDQEVQRLGAIPVMKQIHQQRIEVDAILGVRSLRKRKCLRHGFRAAI